MKLALVGTGQMGQAAAALAPERGHTVAARFDSARPLPEEPRALDGANVVIDFSLPTCAPAHIERYCRWQQPAVVGTTGWYDRLDEVRGWVEVHGASLLYAPNFSLGVALLVRALRAVAPLADRMPELDAYVHETHHVRKVDSPSGTARMLAETLLAGLRRKTHVETEAQHQRIDAEALHVTSTRAGAAFGRHTVGFDSATDHLTFTHEAKGRAGFALGALRAAEWLAGGDAPRRGLFTLDDVLQDMLRGT